MKEVCITGYSLDLTVPWFNYELTELDVSLFKDSI